MINFIVCDYLLVGKFVRAHGLHQIILLVYSTRVVKSSVTNQVLRRDIIVDVTRCCLLECLSMKMFWQGPELFLIHVWIFVIRLYAGSHRNYWYSLDSLLS